MDDLECMACPPKYRHLATFWKYYSGQLAAPYPTLFSERCLRRPLCLPPARLLLAVADRVGLEAARCAAGRLLKGCGLGGGCRITRSGAT